MKPQTLNRMTGHVRNIRTLNKILHVQSKPPAWKPDNGGIEMLTNTVTASLVTKQD